MSNTTVLSELKRFIAVKCNSNNPDRFPGPQPVSIEKKHIPLLSKNEYLVCEKTDGIRHFLACFVNSENKKLCTLVNRSFDHKIFPLTVPRDTLLDGELLGNTYIIHDAMWIQGRDLRKMNLRDRLAHAKALVKVILPIPKLRVVCKDMIPFKDIKQLTLGEHTDGVIFTPVNEPVRMGTHRTLFKWKPLERITVDFLVRNGNFYIQHESKMLVVQRGVPDPEQEGIYECSFDGEKWEPVLKRTDKSHSNNKHTYERTLVNINENIKFCELVLASI
jgi:hypothetical protein